MLAGKCVNCFHRVPESQDEELDLFLVAPAEEVQSPEAGQLLELGTNGLKQVIRISLRVGSRAVSSHARTIMAVLECAIRYDWWAMVSTFGVVPKTEAIAVANFDVEVAAAVRLITKVARNSDAL